MTRLKVFYDDQWQHLPAKTRVECTYEWEGEPHASPSVKRAGDGIVARNLGDNPTTSGTTGWRTNNTANWAIERVALDDHPEGLEQGYRSQAVLDGNHLDNVLSMYDIGGTRLPAEVSGHAYGVWVKVNVPSTTGSRYGSTPIMPDAWTYLTGFRDSYLTGMQILVDDPGDIGAAEAFITGANIATADTEEEALAQVETYYDGGTLSHLGWQGFTPHVTGSIKRIWRQPTPPPAGTSYEWAGGRHASESIKRMDGVEVARSAQVVAPQLIEDGRSLRLAFPIPEDADTYQWSVELRSTEAREGYDEAGFNATFSGPEVNRGLADRFPADGEWQEYSRSYTIDPEATTGHIGFIKSNLTSPWYEVRRLQVAFYADAGWHDRFDGDTESDRAHDLWYNSDGVPHVWANGQGWVAS